MGIRQALYNLLTPEMEKAGAGEMAQYDDRFEDQIDVVPEIFIAMIMASSPASRMALAKVLSDLDDASSVQKE